MIKNVYQKFCPIRPTVSKATVFKSTEQIICLPFKTTCTVYTKNKKNLNL